MKISRAFAFGLVVLLTSAALAGAQTWTPLTHQPSFNASTALLLTDGTVMVQAIETGSWWRLTPNNTGSYINGTWSQLASMPSGYAPLYYASAVLPDGRVVVEGGEYNQGTQAETNMGAIFNPGSNAWTSITAPSGWSHIGDAQSVVLGNGTFMLGNCGLTNSICTPNQFQQAQLNASTLTWSLTGSGKADQNSEEGWTLLPPNPNTPNYPNNGKVLTVDVWNGIESELYDPNTGSWSLAGNTVVQLPNTACDEVGPAVLRPDGTVLAFGGNSNTAIYNSSPYSPGWMAGPSLPPGYAVADGPAVLLPDGNVLVDASPQPYSTPTGCVWPAGSKFFEINGSQSPIAVPAPPRAGGEPSFVGRMLMLPDGNVLFTDGSNDVEVYKPSGTYNFVWQPTINSYPTNITIGASWYPISGTQFNGLSQGAMYGDDAQSATNYPLVRITNYTTGHVFYMFTHNHSSMGVATAGVNVSTLFDPPLNMERGWSYLVVVANGIPSTPVNLNVD
jgi:hypothetical protein